MEELANLAAGILAGTLGAIPFAHTNLILQAAEGAVPAAAVVVFAPALAFSHLVFEAVPSFLLFAPAGDQAASTPAAHGLATRASALPVARMALTSMLLSFLAAVALLPVAVALLPAAFEATRAHAHWALLALACASLAAEARGGSPRGVAAGALVFLISGAFGFLLFTFPLQQEPLFPLLSGLFGIPTVLLALGNFRDKRSQAQAANPGALPGPALIVGGAAIGMLSPLLPAVSPAFLSAAALAFLETSPAAFLQLNSAILPSKMLYEFASVTLIGKARSGAAAAVAEAAPAAGANALPIALSAGAAAFFAAAAAVFIAAPRISKAVGPLGPRANWAALAVITAAVIAYAGPAGLFVAGTAASIGLLPALLGVRRSHAMGALILPSVIYAIGLAPSLARAVKTF